MEDTTKEIAVSEKPTKQIGLRVSEDEWAIIEDVIVPFYRAASLNHAFKLLIEDAAKMIAKGSWEQSLPRTLNND